MENRTVRIEDHVSTERLQAKCFVIMEELGFCKGSLLYGDMIKVVKELVSQNRSILQYLSSELRDNKQIALVAVNRDGCSLRYASDRLRDNEYFAIVAIKSIAIAFHDACERLPHSFAWAAINRDQLVLEYASPRIRNDREFVLDAMAMDRVCFCGASEELREDKEIVLAALNKSSYWAKRFECEQACSSYKGKYANWTEYEIRRDFLILDYLSDGMRDDEEVIMEAVKYYDEPIKSASERIQNLVSSVQGGDTVFEKLSVLKMTYYKSARK